ncbi:nuclear pore complex protein Nup50 [Nymphalis io]|uniref:nuclear pore complex protein Nup50 n=1 Tax=Inachis io TaxID=171585 RepID=UPI002168ACB1|nr:nuclear pore complex protein Nup50 [Nymphalis io]XP_050362452.1 nuclear pore complex protein Nup50 [Nymphalis io]
MSVKRQATTELNHENWDQDDPAEQEEETGGFKMASKEVLEKRVIRTAKRRSQATGDEAKRSVFSGFSAFNKTQPTSFDFLAKLTNGNNATNVSPLKSETLATSSTFNATSTGATTTNSLSSGIGSMTRTSTPLAKSAFGKPMSESSLFGAPTTNSGFGQSVFTTSKPSTAANESPFKMQSAQSATFNTTASKLNTSAEKPAAQSSSNIFGSSSTSANNTKSLFSSTNTNSTPFKVQPVSNSQPSEDNKSTNKSDSQEDKKLIYYSKLKSLNESVSAWIKKHVEEGLCILTPIFKDYEKHLKDIQDEYEKSKTENTTDDKANNEDKKTTSPWAVNTSSSVFPTSSMFSNNKGNATSPEKTSNLTTCINTPTNVLTNNFSTSSPASSGFSFGIKTPSANTSPFALNTTTTTANTNGSTPFSFGIGKPFSFNSNIQKNEEPAKQAEENEDEPPKVEYTPIVEENSVYDKKCKIFVKKDGNFVDKGVGTLYVKKIEDSGKHQLLVRANTSLGNVLLNLILGSSIPTQRMGKNNVMMVCIPTPDAKPPPTSILIRVKTSEEADELLETLNKYKS